MVSQRVSANEDSPGKDIVPQILQFHAEPEATSSKFFLDFFVGAFDLRRPPLQQGLKDVGRICSCADQACGRASVNAEAVRPAGTAPPAIARIIFGERKARTERRRTCRAARPSAAAMSLNDAALPERIESIQPRDRAIARRRACRVSESMVPRLAGAWVTPFRRGTFGAKGIDSKVGAPAPADPHRRGA